MEEIIINHRDIQATEVLSSLLKDYIKFNKNKEIIVINIGTDKMIGDVLAPLVGTLLTENNFKLPVYGTIKNPIHAVNIHSKLNEIKLKHPNAFIIGIDACLGSDDHVGCIQIKNKPVKPGAGVGKKLPEVGDISIVGVVDSQDNADLFSVKNIRLDFVMDIAKVISTSLISATKRYKKNSKEVAVCNF